MSDDYFQCGCNGSINCSACGGVCSTEDPDRLEDVFRKRRLAEEAEAKRGEPEPDDGDGDDGDDPPELPTIRVRRGVVATGHAAIELVLSNYPHPIVITPTAARRIAAKILKLTTEEDVG